MKICYFGLNRRYFNKSYQLYPRIVAESGITTFIGPGYCHAKTFENMTEFRKKFDFVEADLVVCDMDTFGYEFFGFNLDRSYYNFTAETLKKFAKLFDSILPDIKCPVIVYCNFDHYHAPSKLTEKLIKNSAYVISRDRDFWRPKELLVDTLKETHFNAMTDNWYSYVIENNDRVISLPHFITPDEVKLDNRERDIDVSILGVKYYYRLEAIKALKAAGINCVTGELKRKLISKLMQWFPAKFQSSYNASFVKILERSKASFTCGSALGYPLRKYLEIPAAGSILLCKPFLNFHNLGYKSGENCFSVDENDLVEMVQEISRDYSSFSKIKVNASELLLSTHSYEARKTQLKSALQAIVKKEFNGSFWSSGSFCLV